MAKTRPTLRRIFLSAALLCACSSGCTGGGETVVSGIGNSGNRIQLGDKLWEEVAKAFASTEATPKVRDEELRDIFANIRSRALQGDFEAALVVLRIAEEQRKNSKDG